MTRRRLILLFLATAALAACASHERATGADAGSDSDGGGGPLCTMPQPPLALPAACDAFPELAARENVASGAPPIPRYRTELRTAGNTRTSACATEGVPDGGEAIVRFTAPSGGRWRLTAYGEGLRTLSTLRDCAADAECSAFGQYDGPHVAPTLVLDLFAQRDESYALVLDGCPAGAECAFTLEAARIGPLECPPTFAPSVCDPETTRCAIDPCDAERFVCVPQPPDPYDPHPLDGATVLVDRTRELALVSARFRDTPTGPYDGYGILFYEWLAADGSVLPPGSPSAMYIDGLVEAGMLPSRLVAVPTGALAAERVRIWAGLDPAARENAIEVAVASWDRRSAGEPCEVGSLATACAQAHRCVAPAPSTRGTCVRSERLEITSAEAWYSRTASTIRASLEGLTPGEAVSAVRVELLDAGGAALIELPLVHVLGSRDDIAVATFTATMELDRWRLDPSAMVRASTLRARAITVEGRESDAFDVAIGRAVELESGASCADVDASCGDALSCVLRSPGSYCEPTVEFGPCYLDGHTALWAPPGPGTYVIEGVPREWGGFTSCIATRTMSPAAALFIAPTSGRYLFESEGLHSFEVMRSCEMPACVLDEPRLRVEIDLDAGERVPVRLLSDRDAAERFSLQVEVP